MLILWISAFPVQRFYSDVYGDSITPQNEFDNSVNVDSSPPRDERVCIHSAIAKFASTPEYFFN